MTACSTCREVCDPWRTRCERACTVCNRPFVDWQLGLWSRDQMVLFRVRDGPLNEEARAKDTAERPV